MADRGANLAGSNCGYQRRLDEWRHQHELAEAELVQIDQQRAAAAIRVAIAEKNVENHRKQIEQTKQGARADGSGSKPNQELYGWMTRSCTVYFQGYQLAYDVAKRAERAFRQSWEAEALD